MLNYKKRLAVTVLSQFRGQFRGQFRNIKIWCIGFCWCSTFLLNFLYVYSAYSMDKKTLEILSLLKKEEYSSAVHLMEQEIKNQTDNNKKANYALLLNELPNNVSMKKNPYEYAFIAARYAKSISESKRVSLWIEAGDGFFESGYLDKANRCYKEALSLLNSLVNIEQSPVTKSKQKMLFKQKEKGTSLKHSNHEEQNTLYNKNKSSLAYILHKQAWIYVNKKKWIQAFNLFVQALEQKENRLKDIVLSDLGKIWIESQYFKNKVNFISLKKVIKNISQEEKETLMQGMLKGMRRTAKKGIDKIISTFSLDEQLSTSILNMILQDKTVFMGKPCRLLPWMQKSQIQNLDRELSLSVLNSCAQTLTSSKAKKRGQTKTKKKYFNSLVDLYVKMERKGIERWPLLIVYRHIGLKNQACSESLRLLVEVIELKTTEFKTTDLKTTDLKTTELLKEELGKTFSESVQFCNKAKAKPQEIKKVLHVLFNSAFIIQKYTQLGNLYEDSLFNFLNLKQVQMIAKQNILQAKDPWHKKDLLPTLVLSHIDTYQPEEIKNFLSRFNSKPLKKYYLDILSQKPLALTQEELAEILPLSQVDSYYKTLPWFKKALAKDIDPSKRTLLMSKLLNYFPSKKKERQAVSLFLALNYLKTDQINIVLEHWSKLSSAFQKKAIAIEFFEKILYNKNSCINILRPDLMKNIKTSSLLKFIYQCCQMMKNQEDTTLVSIKVRSKKVSNKKKTKYKKVSPAIKLPSILRSSALAWDFVWLSRTEKKTRLLEKGISHLDTQTSKMIMDLKTALSRYQKRKWHFKSVAKQMEALLTRQISLFERELSSLAKSSPYGEKYKALRDIVSQWK